jgi:Kef-type K+ transport system membrane component KefB
MEARDATTVGVLMNTRGLIEIILLTIGLDRGIIDARLFTLLVLVALITTLLAAPLVRGLQGRGAGA